MVGSTQEEAGAKPTVVKATVGDPHDVYTSSAIIVVECALCMAVEPEALTKAGMMRGGVLTPATAMGPVLLNRLQNAGVTIALQEEPGTATK